VKQLKDSEIAARASENLDRRASSLDDDTVRKLRDARFRAAESFRERGWLWRAFHSVTAAGVATAAIAAITVSFWFTSPRFNADSGQPDDIEIITAQETLDIYEDLEFFRWLADHR
jgi:hypothetical protein